MDIYTFLRTSIGRVDFIKKLLHPISLYFTSRNHKKMNKIFHQKGLEVFHKVYYSFMNTNIEFWPEFGTLLGIYREHDFIKHDFDFDFGAWVDDFERIKEILKNNGFKVVHEFEGINHPEIREITFEMSGIQVDFFFFNRFDSCVSCYTFGLDRFDAKNQKNIYKVKKYDYPIFELKEITFKNVNIHIPEPCKDHLVVSYGENFMTPDPNFKTIHYIFMQDTYATSK